MQEFSTPMKENEGLQPPVEKNQDGVLSQPVLLATLPSSKQLEMNLPANEGQDDGALLDQIK